jgi:hypothetical protein
MHVIRHQAVAMNVDPDVQTITGQQIEISKAVGIAEEHNFAIVTALRHVVDSPRNDEPCSTRHMRHSPGEHCHLSPEESGSVPKTRAITLFQAVVWRFFRDDHVVDVALAKAG